MNNPLIDYSIVVPVFCNEGSLKPFFEEIRKKVEGKNKDKKYEIIFIDDGSNDGSLKELLEIKKNSPQLVKIIKFSRNFGQIKAIMAGYEFAKGRSVINISADLQDPPELMNAMLDYFFNDNYDIVIGERDSRDESLFRRISSGIFYQLIKTLSFPNMPKGGFDYVLVSNRVKNIILKNQETNPFFQGQVLWTGFNIKFIPYHRRKREFGGSRWSFGKKLTYLIDGVLSYSFSPLRLISITGIIIAFLGVLYAVVIFTLKLVAQIPTQGWAPIMITILCLSGFQMIMIGIVGEYLWRALDQVRGRQPYIIDKIFD
jgi:glycosyltransferase involved in cell wall biosynthesis